MQDPQQLPVRSRGPAVTVGTRWSEAAPGEEGTSQVCDALGFGYSLVAAACPGAGSFQSQGLCCRPVLRQATSACSGMSMHWGGNRYWLLVKEVWIFVFYSERQDLRIVHPSSGCYGPSPFELTVIPLGLIRIDTYLDL